MEKNNKIKAHGKIQPLYTRRKLHRQNYPSARWVECWEKEAFNQWPVLALDELRVLLRWRQVAHQVAVQEYNQTKKQNRKDIKTNLHEILQANNAEELRQTQSLEFNTAIPLVNNWVKPPAYHTNHLPSGFG